MCDSEIHQQQKKELLSIVLSSYALRFRPTNIVEGGWFPLMSLSRGSANELPQTSGSGIFPFLAIKQDILFTAPNLYYAQSDLASLMYQYLQINVLTEGTTLQQMAVGYKTYPGDPLPKPGYFSQSAPMRKNCTYARWCF